MVTEDAISEVCAGTRACEVAQGNFIVINHTTGERFEPIVGSSNAINPNPDELPIIRADTWEELLRNVVALINAERATERHAMIPNRS